eukprot:TRINITY_DN2810_c0_g1_i2.p1 TRINITY_DN2810_c0_g1~~TRINITY_DN2810_c0_g1_i2.p1  ORF type:complete len:581 (+),score=130.18 TRINITY_DN2810_c0_g1_i2:191-1933(+)
MEMILASDEANIESMKNGCNKLMKAAEKSVAITRRHAQLSSSMGRRASIEREIEEFVQDLNCSRDKITADPGEDVYAQTAVVVETADRVGTIANRAEGIMAELKRPPPPKPTHSAEVQQILNKKGLTVSKTEVKATVTGRDRSAVFTHKLRKSRTTISTTPTTSPSPSPTAAPTAAPVPVEEGVIPPVPPPPPVNKKPVNKFAAGKKLLSRRNSGKMQNTETAVVSPVAGAGGMNRAASGVLKGRYSTAEEFENVKKRVAKRSQSVKAKRTDDTKLSPRARNETGRSSSPRKILARTLPAADEDGRYRAIRTTSPRSVASPKKLLVPQNDEPTEEANPSPRRRSSKPQIHELKLSPLVRTPRKKSAAPAMPLDVQLRETPRMASPRLDPVKQKRAHLTKLLDSLNEGDSSVIDALTEVLGDRAEWAGQEEQVLGRLTAAYKTAGKQVCKIIETVYSDIEPKEAMLSCAAVMANELSGEMLCSLYQVVGSALKGLTSLPHEQVKPIHPLILKTITHPSSALRKQSVLLLTVLYTSFTSASLCYFAPLPEPHLKLCQHYIGKEAQFSTVDLVFEVTEHIAMQ